MRTRPATCVRTVVATLCVVSIGIAVSGCDGLPGLLGGSTTTVRLVNNSDFDVDATLFIDDEQNLPRDLLTEIGTELQFVVPAGSETSFSRDCEDLQIVVVDDADLLLIGQVGPEANSDVLRDGDDFGCGGTIVFTFDHSAAILDFDVQATIQP